LARELASVRSELDNARIAVSPAKQAAAAEKQQRQVLEQERSKAEALSRELASVQQEAEERSAYLTAPYAEGLRETETKKASAAEQKRGLASKRDRADALIRSKLGNLQIVALYAQRAIQSCESAVTRRQKRTAEPTAESRAREAVAELSESRGSASNLQRRCIASTTEAI
jgi:hypothetical protein